MDETTFHHWMELVVQGFEVVGVGVLALGSAWALVGAVLAWLRGSRAGAYRTARQGVGRSILLGLEVIIIADIVQTITIDQSLESAAVLGIIVLIRTFLSFSIDIELDGVPPWRRGRAASDG